MDGEQMQFEMWHGCYDDGWRDMIVPDAFAHPAKYARGLIERIILEGVSRGWWQTGDTIGDPFGGIGTGGIVATYHGLKWIGVELEPKFAALAKQNFDLHVGRWRVLGAALPEMQVGDSRRFAEIVRAAGIVTSPPYVGGGHSGNQVGGWGGLGEIKGGNADKEAGGYGGADGQIGRLPPGDVSAIVTSPPYAETSPESVSTGIDLRKNYETYRASGGGCSFEKFVKSRERHMEGYGNSAGQIGALRSGDVDAVVTSPPWEDQEPSHAQGSSFTAEKTVSGRSFVEAEYGRSEGQIGNDSGETYWTAMRDVYAQCRLALRPCGILAVVVKDYVKSRQRVPLCDQTHALLLYLGFAPVTRVRAMLVKERRHSGLWGEHVETKERKSFFRRLAEKKGSPRIDWEEVIVVKAPGAAV